MFKISKKVEYALIVLKHFDDLPRHESVQAKTISDTYFAPFDTVSRVMQLMAQHHILTSQKGVSGGYSLGSNLEDISYLELAQIVERKSFDFDCSSQGCSLIETCNISRPVKRLHQHLNLFFKQLTIKDVISDQVLITNDEKVEQAVCDEKNEIGLQQNEVKKDQDYARHS